MCAISRFLARHDGFIALFFLVSEEVDLFVFQLPLILPTGIADIPSSICACVSVASCAFLGENILDFDVGNGDAGDGRSRGRVIPEGRVVRGEENGERRGGGS